jgi:hypothetical protein
VTVYADGFVVYSREGGDTIEITNVEENLVFLRHIRPDLSSRTVIGDRSGQIVSCSVSLVDDKGERLKGDIDRSCSTAAFSPLAQVQSPIIADVYVPAKNDKSFCKLKETPANKDLKGQLEDEKTGSKDADFATPWWMLWPVKLSFPFLFPLDPGNRKNIYPTIKKKSEVDGKIVLAQRGDCLFEEKALKAQKAGASAIIIANSEVQNIRVISFLISHQYLWHEIF